MNEFHIRFPLHDRICSSVCTYICSAHMSSNVRNIYLSVNLNELRARVRSKHKIRYFSVRVQSVKGTCELYDDTLQ